MSQLRAALSIYYGHMCEPWAGVKDESELSEVLVSVMITPDSRLRALKLFMIHASGGSESVCILESDL